VPYHVSLSETKGEQAVHYTRSESWSSVNHSFQLLISGTMKREVIDVATLNHTFS